MGGITHPQDGKALDWQDTGTWFCFDCQTRDADSWFHLDGYVRCPECEAKWSEWNKHDPYCEWVGSDYDSQTGSDEGWR